jgi:GGDEF domain-containing protein
VAEELRSTVEAGSLLPGQPVTISVGFATYGDDPDWEAWLKRCDDNLYGAKAAGPELRRGVSGAPESPCDGASHRSAKATSDPGKSVWMLPICTTMYCFPS